MNTPITDRLQLKLGGSRVVRLEDARRMERDRAALIEALGDCIGWTHRAIDLEVSGSMQLAQKLSVEKANNTLAAARANFPTP